MTVLVEAYWQEIRDGLAEHGVPVRHVVLHADEATLRARIDGDRVLGPSTFRQGLVDDYLAAFHGWLGREAEAVDTTDLAPEEVARRVAEIASAAS